MLPAAAKGGLFEILELLLVKGADFNIVPPCNHYATALQEAVGRKDFKMVQLLLRYHANPNIPGPVWDDGIREWRTGTALQTAVDTENLELAQILIKAGARADVLSAEHKDRIYPLEAAMGCFYHEEKLTLLVQSLLAAGTDVNLPGTYTINTFEWYRDLEETALLAAVERENAQLVKILLRAGANMNAVSTSKHRGPRSPLQEAVLFSGLKMSKLLLDAGADAKSDILSDAGFHDEADQGTDASLLAITI